MTSSFRHKQGSSLVESCIVMTLLCLILFGFLQASYQVTARNVLNYAGIATTRAAAVGLDPEMVDVVSHYATIPTAGPMVYPAPEKFRTTRPQGERLWERWEYAMSSDHTPRSEMGEYEVGVAETFHRDEYPLAVLNYANWSPEGDARVHSDYDEDDYGEEVLEITLSQQLPLTLPFARVFFPLEPLIKVYRNGRVEEYPAKTIDVTTYMENHALFYLKGMTD